jgi:hypothetical protein
MALCQQKNVPLASSQVVERAELFVRDSDEGVEAARKAISEARVSVCRDLATGVELFVGEGDDWIVAGGAEGGVDGSGGGADDREDGGGK